MKRLVTIAAVLTMPVGIVACSSSSSPSALKSSPDTATTVPVTTTLPVVNAGNDKQRVAAIQLKASDLPSGWKPQHIDTPPSKQREEDAYFDKCLGVPTIEDEQTTSSDVEFGRSDGLSFTDGLVNVTNTEPEAAADQAALTGPKGVSCTLADAKKFLTAPKGAKIVSLTANRLSVPAGEIGLRLVSTLRLSNGREVSVTSDTIGVIVKRFEVQLNFTGVIQAPQKALEQAVAAKVFARAIANAS